MENVKFRYRVYDNFLEIIPEDGVKDNSIYTIKIKKISSQDRKSISHNISHEMTTAMRPFYCKVEAVRILIDAFEIPESTIIYMIHKASKQADFINGGPVDISNGVPYVVEKYTEIKATLEALLVAYIVNGNDSGLEVTLGKISFKNGTKLSSIKNLIDDLKKEALVWQDAIRGYILEGRNKPRYAVRSSNIAPYTITAIPLSEIIKGYTREFNFKRY